MISHLATLLLLPAAVLAWRLSRPIALALCLVLSSTLAYLALAHAYPEAHARGAFEAQRLVSVVMGLVGAIELWRGTERARLWWSIRTTAATLQVFPAGDGPTIDGARRRVDPTAAMGLICLASMASDGTAWLLYRAGRPWVFDLAQVLFLTAICVVESPRKRGSS